MMLFGDVIEKHLLAGRLLDYVLLFHRFLSLFSQEKLVAFDQVMELKLQKFLSFDFAEWTLLLFKTSKVVRKVFVIKIQETFSFQEPNGKPLKVNHALNTIKGVPSSGQSCCKYIPNTDDNTMPTKMITMTMRKSECFTSIGLLYWLTSMPSLKLFVTFFIIVIKK